MHLDAKFICILVSAILVFISAFGVPSRANFFNLGIGFFILSFLMV